MNQTIKRLRRKLIPFSVDILNREYSLGWCFNRVFKQSPLLLSFYVGRKLVGETVCALLREDLVEQNLHPDGHAGFECLFPEPLRCGSGDVLSLHVNNSRFPLLEVPGQQVLDVFKPVNRIFFMHIPKTAGTSFNNYIRQYFGYGKSHTHIQTTPLAEQQAMATASHFMSGHITLEHIETIYAGTDNLDIHTIVRDPVKQLHSHIGWVKGIALVPEGEFFKKHHHLVQKMGRDLFNTDLSDPRNLKALADNLDGFQIDFFDNIQTRYFLDYRPDRVEQKDCDNAIDNLSRFKTIGLTEDFGHYTGEFCDYYRIEQKPITSVHNPSRVRPLFDVNDPDTLAAIEPMVRYDRQLYQAIRQSKGM